METGFLKRENTMIRFPTFLLEGHKLPRVILSVLPSLHSTPQEILTLMRKAYERDVWCFDLPSPRHVQVFGELKNLVGEEPLIGLPHIGAEEGASLFGIPLHRFEGKIMSTIQRNLFSPDLIRTLKTQGFWKNPAYFPTSNSPEVFTQKEMDRIHCDSSRFDRALSRFQPRTHPFIFIGERYGDWLLALGKSDILKELVSRTKGKGFLPILSGRWATFFLPKAKPLDAVAYAVPLNKVWSFFDHPQACALAKKFDKPIFAMDSMNDKTLRDHP